MSLKSWMQNVYESQFPGNVGIWWADREKLYVNLHEVEDGRDYEGNMHSVTSHEKAWKSTVLNHRPDLKGYSYTCLPRGRVYCQRSTGKFFTVGTPELLKLPRFIAELEAQFSIQNLQVSTEADEHYIGIMEPDVETALATLEAWK
jgi:hypothetical protein